MIKLRTQQIVIDIPRTLSEPWIMITVQRVELDAAGNEMNVIDRWGTINKRLSAVALQVESYFEVLPLEPGQITVFGIADAIKSTAIDWIIEKYGGSKNAAGDVIL